MCHERLSAYYGNEARGAWQNVKLGWQFVVHILTGQIYRNFLPVSIFYFPSVNHFTSGKVSGNLLSLLFPFGPLSRLWPNHLLWLSPLEENMYHKLFINFSISSDILHLTPVNWGFCGLTEAPPDGLRSLQRDKKQSSYQQDAKESPNETTDKSDIAEAIVWEKIKIAKKEKKIRQWGSEFSELQHYFCVMMSIYHKHAKWQQVHQNCLPAGTRLLCCCQRKKFPWRSTLPVTLHPSFHSFHREPEDRDRDRDEELFKIEGRGE